MPGKDLIVRVVEVKGRCPLYREGEAFRIAEGFKLVAERPLCMHALASLMPYYVALSHGVSPAELGLAEAKGGQGQIAYVQCLDPCERTGGGTVVFAISKDEPSHRQSRGDSEG
ncbi:TPA: TIGR04076 family protein [Candidatus Bipolaricaulota bacterium]|nr:TIGR04076 family protein [Candidatus Bipolaricaulota bacterium]